MPKRVLVTGKNGQLGQSLQKLVNVQPVLGVQFDFVGREQLDLSSADSVAQFFNSQAAYDAIINTAAYTAVDKAETERELADQVNHLAVEQLASIAAKQQAFLLHVSTDYVFSGTGHRPYVEADAVAPVNHYGHTKLLGEQAMQNSGCAGVIVRTSWVYSEFGNNFVKTMLRLGREREQLGVIFDQVGTPTYAPDLAAALLTILQQYFAQPAVTNVVEIFHFSNEGVCSWYDFAKAIFELAEVRCMVNPIETQAYPTPAKRPHYSLLNKAAIKQRFGLDIPYWRDSLGLCLKELEKN